MEKKGKKYLSDFKRTVGTTGRLLGLVWRLDKKYFLGQSVAVAIPAVIPFINAYVYKLIIDQIVSAASTRVVDYRELGMLMAIRLITLILQDASWSATTYLEKTLYIKLPSKLNMLILEKTSSLDLEQFENKELSERLDRIRESYSWRPLNMISYFFYGFQSLLQFVIALFALAYLNWWLVIIMLASVTPTFISRLRYSKTVWGIMSGNSPYRRRYWYLSDVLQDGDMVKEVKIFETGKRMLGELSKLFDKFLSEYLGAAKRKLSVEMFLDAAGTLLYIIVEVFVIISAALRRITIGDISYYTSVLNNFQSAAGGLFRNAGELFDSSMYVADIFDVLSLESKIKEPANPVKLSEETPPRIEFRKVNFSYPGSNKKVFEDFSFTIEPGEKIAIVGENGAGKTTLVKLLARFYDPDSGAIFVNGIDLKELELKSWRRMLGVLFQDFIKYRFPLKDNIGFGKAYKDISNEEISAAARMSGADKVAEGLPNKYEQMLGRRNEDGEELSGGQWQKVALARVFLRNAPVLILDEPTAAIDAKAEYEIFSNVETLSKDKTVIIISHRFSTVKNADKIYVIDNGKIIEDGSHPELIKKKGVYAELFNLQAKAYK